MRTEREGARSSAQDLAPFYRDRSLTSLLLFPPTPPLGPFSVRQALLLGQPLGLLRVTVTVVVVDLLLVGVLGHALGVELGRSRHLLAALLYRHPAPARVGDGLHWDHEVLLAQSQKASSPDFQKAHVFLFRVDIEILHGPYLLPIPIVDVVVEQSLGSRVAGKVRVSKLDERHRAKTSFAGRRFVR